MSAMNDWPGELRVLLARHGSALLQLPGSLEMFLKAAHGPAPQVGWLLRPVRVGVVDEMIEVAKAGRFPAETVDEWASRLADTDEVSAGTARWAVETWAAVLARPPEPVTAVPAPAPIPTPSPLPVVPGTMSFTKDVWFLMMLAVAGALGGVLIASEVAFGEYQPAQEVAPATNPLEQGMQAVVARFGPDWYRDRLHHIQSEPVTVLLGFLAGPFGGGIGGMLGWVAAGRRGWAFERNNPRVLAGKVVLALLLAFRGARLGGCLGLTTGDLPGMLFAGSLCAGFGSYVGGMIGEAVGGWIILFSAVFLTSMLFLPY